MGSLFLGDPRKRKVIFGVCKARYVTYFGPTVPQSENDIRFFSQNAGIMRKIGSWKPRKKCRIGFLGYASG